MIPSRSYAAIEQGWPEREQVEEVGGIPLACATHSRLFRHDIARQTKARSSPRKVSRHAPEHDTPLSAKRDQHERRA
eukprot:15445470-Alexandrium_andersonii.AAC.1